MKRLPLIWLIIAVCIILGATAGPALGAINFDPATGTGTVDASDAAAYFNWGKPGDVNKKAATVAFVYSKYNAYTVVATNGAETVYSYPSVEERTPINSTYSKGKKQWTLSGYGVTEIVGTVPRVGDTYAGPDGTNYTITAVTQDIFDARWAALWWGGNALYIWP